MLASVAGVLGLRLLLPILSGFLGRMTGLPVSPYASLWSLVGGLLVGHAWTLRLVERRGWSYVRLGREALRPGAIALGAGLGVAAVSLPVLALLAIGWLRVEPAAPGSSLAAASASLAVLVPASIWEELLARGFVFALLREVWGDWRALIVTSAGFGLLHLLNAGATVQSVLVVTMAGVFLGGVVIRTASLYAAWAAHFAWNFMLAGVMHANVSGLGFAAPDFRLVDAGPDWATGGQWGPEGGLFAAAGLIAALLLLFRRPEGRGEGGA